LLERLARKDRKVMQGHWALRDLRDRLGQLVRWVLKDQRGMRARRAPQDRRDPRVPAVRPAPKGRMAILGRSDPQGLSAQLGPRDRREKRGLRAQQGPPPKRPTPPWGRWGPRDLQAFPVPKALQGSQGRQAPALFFALSAIRRRPRAMRASL
jgi:hypothetical protein